MKRIKTAKGRKPSSTRWLERQLNDPYVKRAKAENYRSRAAFKLLELDETRKTAERELEINATQKERMADLEADRDALLASLMDIAPMALDSLTPEERRRFYRLLGLRVIAYPDRALEVEFGDGLSIREKETVQGRCSASAA